MPAFAELTYFRRMEQPRRWNRMCVPLAGAWHDSGVELLKVSTVAPAGSKPRSDRWTKAGKAGKAGKSFLKAKECPPAVSPYLLGHGLCRCKADVDATNKWTHVVHDVDAAPMTLRELFHVVARAFGGLRHVLWTTWSSQDGQASARILIPLSRTCTAEEAAAMWWLTRRWLVEAGLTEESAKAGEPCDDSRAMDGAEEKLVRRWRQGRDDQGLLIVPASVGDDATTLLLAGPGETIPDLDAANILDAADVADEVEKLILGQTWGRAGTHGLRGDRKLVGAICFLCDALLGRQRAKEVLEGGVNVEDNFAFVVTTTATLAEVEEAVERSWASPCAGGIWRFRLSPTTTWTAPGGVDRGAVLRKRASERVLRFVGPQPVAPVVELLLGCLSAEGEAEIEAELMAA